MKRDIVQKIIREEIEKFLTEFTAPSKEIVELKNLYYQQKKVYTDNNKVGLIWDEKISDKIKNIMSALQKAYGVAAKKIPGNRGESVVSAICFIPEKPTGEAYLGNLYIVSLVKDPVLLQNGEQNDKYYTIEIEKNVEITAEDAQRKYGSTMIKPGE